MPRPLFWWALAVVVAVRVAWFVLYVWFARRRSPLRLMTSALYEGTDERRRAEIHQRVAEETNKLTDTCLVTGTLALAAWTALFAVADQAPASRLSPTSRSLLLVGSVVLIAAPILFRVPDLHTTYIGRRSAQFAGLIAVGLSFASIANDLLGGTLRVVVAASAVVILVARDAGDTTTEIRWEHQLLKERPPPAAVAAPVPEPGEGVAGAG